MRPNSNIGPNVPAFLRKLWKIVNDPSIDDLIGWSPDGESFSIRNPAEFCYNLLPIYYKHNNMSSFIRQLNMYGFHKLANESSGDKDEIKFFHPFFQQDQARLLQHIKRKIGSTKPEDRKVPLDQIGKVLSDVKHLRGRQETVDSQLSTMKQENAALWRELALLRQKHIKQQQIVNKFIQILSFNAYTDEMLGDKKLKTLIHFLVSLVQQPSRTTIGVKRRFPLMINNAPDSPAIKLNKTSEGATIHEIDAEATQSEDSLLNEIPTVTSPLDTSPIVANTDILDTILVENLDNEEIVNDLNTEATVEDLLHDSEEIDFQTPNVEPANEASNELNNKVTIENVGVDNIEEINTPQILLSEDGTTLLNANEPLLNAAKSSESGEDQEKKKDLTVAMRNSPQDFSNLINNANEFGIHLNSTQGELDSIKDMLFDGGLTLDANAFLDLFNPNDSISQIPISDDDWPSSSNNDQLFSGSELISYNPNEVLNFDNLLDVDAEIDDETG